MGIFGDAINYIIGLGASVMLPLVIAILSIIVGVKVGKAIRAGLMVGVGFVGLGLIVDMMNANLGPAAKGHALILPKEHFKDVCELDEKTAARVLPLGAKIGTAMKKSLGCAGFNLVQNNGAAAGQTVFHFHVHIIPRYEGGPKIVTWTPGEEAPEILAETAEKIKEALEI